MKINIAILLALIVFNVELCAQNYELSGVIINESSIPLPYTNIIAKPSSEKLDIVFAIADEQGRYKLNLKKDHDYNITVSYLGFESFSFKVKLNDNTEKNIQLLSKNNELDEVIIKERLAVVVKEDTIVYDPESFLTGTERKLKEVLKRLPGVEVNKDGSITVFGKKVNKLLVDGKSFFGGGTKLGVENIPADVIEEIEVLDNYNEVAFLKGLNDSEKIAMNVKLKKNKNKFVFGDVEAGGGSENQYLVHPTIFYYSPKTNINVIGDVNNVGVNSFTLKDYLNFEGGLGKLVTNPSSTFKLSNNDFAQFLENQDFTANKSVFGAINTVISLNEKLSTSAYLITSRTITNTRNEASKEYFTGDFRSLENRITESELENFFLMGKLSLNYSPSSNADFSYNAFIKTTENGSISNLISSLDGSFNELNTKLDTDMLSLKQNAEWHRKFSRKHTISLATNFLYNENNPFANWLSSESILQDFVPLQNEIQFNIFQRKKLKIQNGNLLFKNYWVLNNNNHIYTTVSNNFLYEDYFTNDFQLLSDGSINNFNSGGFGNDLKFLLNNFSVGVQHKFKIGKLKVKYGITSHNFSWNISQSTQIKKSKTVWTPDFLAEFDFDRSEHLNFSYNLRSSFVDGPQFANRFQLTGFNSVRQGNENLENELFHAARLWYTKFSLYRGTVMSGSIGYTRKVESIRNEIRLEGINQITKPLLTKNPENTWVFNGNIRKKINNKISGKLSANYRSLDYKQFINNRNIHNESSTSRFSVEIITNFKKWPNIEVGYSKSFSEFSSSNSSSKFTNENPYLNLEYYFLNGFILKADYSSNTYEDNNKQKNRYEIANASLFYQKEDSPWGFKLSGTNIFGIEFKNRNSFSDFVISDDRIFVLPRIWLFSVTYKL